MIDTADTAIDTQLEPALDDQQVIVLDPAQEDPTCFFIQNWIPHVCDITTWCRANLGGYWEIHDDFMRNRLRVVVDSEDDAVLVRLVWQ